MESSKSIKSSRYKTERYIIIMGINEGYFHNNEKQSLKPFIDTWQKHATSIFETTGVYVSAVIKPANVVYNTDWGCPDDGEFVAEITATRNPSFGTTSVEYSNILFHIIKELQNEFNQTTVTIEKIDVELTYNQTIVPQN